jgi:uncharacterized damage-inducible protein DinB
MASQAIQEFRAFIPYIEDLRALEESVWQQPIAPGKWTLKELVCHLWNWDRFSVDVMVPLMTHGASLPAFVDIEEHNQTARELAKSFNSASELIDAFVQTRTALTEEITKKYDSQVRFTIGGFKRKYSIDSYIEIFTHHDEQHKAQIENMKLSMENSEVE